MCNLTTNKQQKNPLFNHLPLTSLEEKSVGFRMDFLREAVSANRVLKEVDKFKKKQQMTGWHVFKGKNGMAKFNYRVAKIGWTDH